MKWKIIAAIAFSISVAVAAEMDLGSVTIVQGEFAELNYDGAPYGGLKGTIRLRIGNYTWHPDDIWLIPEGMTEDQFSYTGQYYSLPSEMNLTNNCRSSIYYNETENKYAFKAGIDTNGDYCILGNSGQYKVIAVY